MVEPPSTDAGDVVRTTGIQVQSTSEMKEYLAEDPDLAKFRSLLFKFIRKQFLPTLHIAPIKISEEVFHFPGENYNEPQIRFSFPSFEQFNHSELIHQFNQLLNAYFVEQASSEDEFLSFCALRRKFRIFFTVEQTQV